jgi:hypothetical protein
MSQGKRLEREVDKIWQLRGEGLSIDKIMDRLSSMNIQVSRGSVAKYVKQYDQLTEQEKENYKSLDWNRLEDYEFSHEVNRFLLRAWSGIGASITMAQARWLAKIYNLAPDISVVEAQHLGDLFVYRERAFGRLGPVDNTDLWAYLASHRWGSQKEDRFYLEAVSRGYSPPLSLTPPNMRRPEWTELACAAHNNLSLFLFFDLDPGDERYHRLWTVSGEGRSEAIEPILTWLPRTPWDPRLRRGHEQAPTVDQRARFEEMIDQEIESEGSDSQ